MGAEGNPHCNQSAVAKTYQNDTVNITHRFQFLIKQHNPDWADIQLLLDCMTETDSFKASTGFDQ